MKVKFSKCGICRASVLPEEMVTFIVLQEVRKSPDLFPDDDVSIKVYHSSCLDGALHKIPEPTVDTEVILLGWADNVRLFLYAGRTD